MVKTFAIVTIALGASITSLAFSEETPLSIPGAETITVSQAKALFDDGVIFIDPRKDTDWDAGRIPESEHLELKSDFNEVNIANLIEKNEPFVVYCNGITCHVSLIAAERAVEWGYTSVKWFRGGLPAWKEAGYPIE